MHISNHKLRLGWFSMARSNSKRNFNAQLWSWILTSHHAKGSVFLPVYVTANQTNEILNVHAMTQSRTENGPTKSRRYPNFIHVCVSITCRLVSFFPRRNIEYTFTLSTSQQLNKVETRCSKQRHRIHILFKATGANGHV